MLTYLRDEVLAVLGQDRHANVVWIEVLENAFDQVRTKLTDDVITHEDIFGLVDVERMRDIADVGWHTFQFFVLELLLAQEADFVKEPTLDSGF